MVTTAVHPQSPAVRGFFEGPPPQVVSGISENTAVGGMKKARCCSLFRYFELPSVGVKTCFEMPHHWAVYRGV